MISSSGCLTTRRRNWSIPYSKLSQLTKKNKPPDAADSRLSASRGEMNKQILTARYWLAPSSGCHLVGEPETEKRTHDFPSSMDTPSYINRPVLFILNLLVPVHSISAFSILPGPSELAASPAMDAPLDSLAVDLNPPCTWSQYTPVSELEVPVKGVQSLSL